MASLAHTWPLVLAGGNGTRLASITTTEDGTTVPKQFCPLVGERTLLEQSLERAERLAPSDRTFVVVSDDHEPWWRSQLPTDNGLTVVSQRANRGTATGVLLPLLQMHRRDPRAITVLLPSDHHVLAEETLCAAIERAVECVRAADPAAVLLGIEPEHPEPSYGWIVPGAPRDGARTVEAFVEKPSEPTAQRLLEADGLWSPFIVAASVQRLLDIFAVQAPQLYFAARRLLPRLGDGAVRYDNRALPSIDFSGEVLQRAPEALRVVKTPACGWTDLGTPERLRQRQERLGQRRAALAN